MLHFGVVSWTCVGLQHEARWNSRVSAVPHSQKGSVRTAWQWELAGSHPTALSSVALQRLRRAASIPLPNQTQDSIHGQTPS